MAKTTNPIAKPIYIQIDFELDDLVFDESVLSISEGIILLGELHS